MDQYASMRPRGKTTLQLQYAPHNTMFVVHSDAFKYYVQKLLADKIKRDDITVVCVNSLPEAAWGSNKYIVYDHYLSEAVSVDQFEMMLELQQRNYAYATVRTT